MEYVTLSAEDRLLLARDTLRGRESDHFRLSLLDEPNKEARLKGYEETIEKLKSEVEDLEKEIKDRDRKAQKELEDLPVTDPDSPVPVEELTPQQKAARTRKENAREEEDNG